MKNFLILLCLFALSGCAVPVLIVGTTAAVGTLSLREKGVTGTVGDSQMSAMISAKLLQQDSAMFTQVDVNVQGGEALLTGFVSEPKWQVEAERIAWSVNGIKSVNNNIQVSDEGTLGTYMSDCLITSKAKNALLFETKIKSLNYSVKTVGGILYLMGIAQHKAEHDLATHVLSKISSIKQIVSYVRIKGIDPTL
jgi:osmotically-inducible protein OsmY